MELYNFFTIPKEDKTDLEARMPELEELCVSVSLIEHSGRHSIIGQLYGEDTNVGDIDLLVILSGVDFVWFNAFNPSDNNIGKK